MHFTRMLLVQILDIEEAKWTTRLYGWVSDILVSEPSMVNLLEFSSMRILDLYAQLLDMMSHIQYINKIKLKFIIRQIVLIAGKIKLEAVKPFLSVRALLGSLSGFKTIGELLPYLQAILPTVYRLQTKRFIERASEPHWKSVTFEELGKMDLSKVTYRSCPLPSAGTDKISSLSWSSDEGEDQEIVKLFSSESPKKPAKQDVIRKPGILIPDKNYNTKPPISVTPSVSTMSEDSDRSEVSKVVRKRTHLTKHQFEKRQARHTVDQHLAKLREAMTGEPDKPLSENNSATDRLKLLFKRVKTLDVRKVKIEKP